MFNIVNFIFFSEFVVVLCNFFTSTKVIFDNESNTFKLNLNLNGNSSVIMLKFKNIKEKDIFSKDAKILMVDNNDEVQEIVDDLRLLEGSDPSGSYAIGYLKESFFYGTIYTNSNVYYLKEINDLKLNKANAAVYEIGDITWRSKRNVFEHENSYRKYKSFVGNGRICSLSIIVDHSYLCTVHKNNLHSSVSRVVSAIDTLNSIYRTTDFDNDNYPDNIGFKIKYFMIVQSSTSEMNILPKYSKKTQDASKYIAQFANYKFLEEVCLGIAFTAQIFKESVIGLSFQGSPNPKTFNVKLGGICERPLNFGDKTATNILTITSRNERNSLTDIMLDLVVAHEVGHSFAALHDSTRECEGYIMRERVNDGSKVKHYLFSKCSKNDMFKTILSKGFCMEKSVEPFCGNGIIEEGEECDCGLIQQCDKHDPCCVPRGQDSKSCKINRSLGFTCHPSEGLCCLKNCVTRDLSKYELNCKNFKIKCPCNNRLSCDCGLNSQCINEQCHSIECIRINSKECPCPINNSKTCTTCCLDDNLNCISAKMLTDKLCKSNPEWIQKLEKHRKKEKNVVYGSFKSFCDTSKCVTLFFREVTRDKFCILFGDLGICNASFQCEVPLKKRKIQYSTTSSGVKIVQSYLYVLLMFVNLLK